MTKSLGPRSFSRSLNAMGERSATAPTCRASPAPPRSSSWPGPTASRFPTSTTKSACTRRRRRIPITTEPRTEADEHRGGFSLRPDVPVRLPDLVVDPGRARPAGYHRQLAVLQPRGDQPVGGPKTPVGTGVVVRLVVDADRGAAAPN